MTDFIVDLRANFLLLPPEQTVGGVVAAILPAMLERTGQHRKVTWTVKVNAMPGRSMRWSFVTSNGLTGEGVTSYGVEAAHRDCETAAIEAITSKLDG